MFNFSDAFKSISMTSATDAIGGRTHHSNDKPEKATYFSMPIAHVPRCPCLRLLVYWNHKSNEAMLIMIMIIIITLIIIIILSTTLMKLAQIKICFGYTSKRPRKYV